MWSLSALSIHWVNVGLGKHIDQVPSSRHSELALILFVFDFIYNTGLTIVKMSVLCFYIRIFQTVFMYKIFFWVAGALIISWCVTFNFLSLFTCVPIHKSWDLQTPGFCLSHGPIFLATAIPNILIDFLLLVLPMPMIWRLHLDTGRKVALLGVFAAGYWQVSKSTAVKVLRS